MAAPVLLGMMLKLAALPPLQSLADGPSTVFWVAGIEVWCCHFTANYKHLPNNASTVQKIGQQQKKKLTCDGMNRGIFAWSRDYVFGTTLLFKGKMQLSETGNWNLEKASEYM